MAHTLVCGKCFSLYLNKSTSYLLLCLSLNSFCDETSRTWASLDPETRFDGFWLGLSPSHGGSSPKQGFSWVWVPAHGFESQSVVNSFSWMASLIQWTWVWANSGRQWKTGKLGMLQSMGSHRVDWTTCSCQYYSLTAKTWKEPKCPLTDERISEIWYIQTMDYDSALKRKEILQYATAWMNFGNIMLSEVNQSEKDKYCMIPLRQGT